MKQKKMKIDFWQKMGLTMLLACVVFMLPVSVLRAQNQYTLNYDVAFDTEGHYLLVTLDYTATPDDRVHDVVFNMPVWAPGYYEILDFPKHLCDFSATDREGQWLAWYKEGKNRWRVQLPADGHARITYRVFANERDVASSRVETDIAFVAPCGVFMHVDGDLGHSVRVNFSKPNNWAHIATGLRPIPNQPCSFLASDFDTLYDSPFLLGNFYTHHFSHEGHDYDFALETPDGSEELDLEGKFCRIVSAATQLMRHVPYDNYCLIHMGQGGGGLEHFNSQACYTDGTYRFESRRAEVKFLAFVAHEYFHLYNVKCIRPTELWPIDYNCEAYTPMLWVSEGLTCYYEFRLLRYAGIASADEALELLTTYFSLYAPYEGQRHQSLRQSSYDIWLNFMNHDANSRDVRINYYFKGPVIGLLLDIDIRRRTQQRRSLDDVMRLLYNRFYLELRRGFTEEEFWECCADVAGGPLTEVRRAVDTTADIDYDYWLKDAGLHITEDFRIVRDERPTKSQRDFLRSMQLAE